MKDDVYKSDGDPILCPFRGMTCNRNCALYGSWNEDSGCAFFQIANNLYDLTDTLMDGLDVTVDDGHQ
jgi:hypothetical protein